jgi:hypothetical protein
MYSLKNKRAIQFYKDHPEIDFDAVNLIFVELLEKLLSNMSNTLNENLSVDMLKEISANVSQHSLLLKTLDERTKDDISSLKTNIDSSVSNQKDSIIASMREVVNNKENNDAQFIHKIISDNHELLSERINKNLENLPKELQTSIVSKSDITEELAKTHSSLSEELAKFFSSQNSPASLTENISSLIESKYNELNASLSTRVESVLSSATTTNNSTLSDILERLKPMLSVEEYFRTNNNSNIKGKRGENKLEPLLSQILPEANIINSSGSAESGDFMIERTNKPTVLIDTKDYNTSVPKKEVDKIIRDIERRKCCGILLSQNSGISLKYDFEINVHNNYVVVFLHNVKYNEEKISLAIQIIDMLYPIIQQNANLEHESISSEQLNTINKEFQEIISQKRKVIEQIEQHNKDIIKSISKIDIPTLSSLLTAKFSQSEKLNYVCDICNDYVGKNSRALGAHKRGCAKRHNPMLVVET